MLLVAVIIIALRRTLPWPLPARPVIYAAPSWRDAPNSCWRSLPQALRSIGSSRCSKGEISYVRSGTSSDLLDNGRTQIACEAGMPTTRAC
jgi:hypothetical protein